MRLVTLEGTFLRPNSDPDEIEIRFTPTSTLKSVLENIVITETSFKARTDGEGDFTVQLYPMQPELAPDQFLYRVEEVRYDKVFHTWYLRLDVDSPDYISLTSVYPSAPPEFIEIYPTLADVRAIAANLDAAIYTKLNTTNQAVIDLAVKDTTLVSKNDIGTLVPALGPDGLIDPSYIHAIRFADTFVAADQDAMLAMPNRPYSTVCVRYDIGQSYILVGQDSTNLTSWVPLSDNFSVTSVNGRTGTVILNSADLGAAPMEHNHDSLSGQDFRSTYTQAQSATVTTDLTVGDEGQHLEITSSGIVFKNSAGDTYYHLPGSEVNISVVKLIETVPTYTELPTDLVVADEGKAWVADDTKETWYWTGYNYVNLGTMTGPTGPPGPQGIQGPVGQVGPIGAQGPIGPRGEAASLTVISGDVLTEAELPTTLTQADAGKGWIVTDTQDVWVWSGTSWTNIGEVQGPPGPEGPPGAEGAQGVEGPQGAQGPIGLTGPQGPQGLRGDKGDKGDTGATGLTGSTGPTGPAPSTANLVLKTGDTMTGALVLPANPTSALQATTKQYVDALSLKSLTDVSDTDTPVEGDTMIYTAGRWEFQPGSQVTEIPNAADLNTYLVTGTYTQYSTAQAVAGLNYPIDLAGMLEVAASPDGQHIWQRYTVYGRGGAVSTDIDANVTWQRARYTGTWDLWKPMAWGKPFVWNQAGWNDVTSFADFNGQNWGQEVYLDTAGRLRARPDVLLPNGIATSAAPSAWPSGVTTMGVSSTGGYPGSGTLLSAKRESSDWTMQMMAVGPSGQKIWFRFGSTSFGPWEMMGGPAYSEGACLTAYSGWSVSSSGMHVHGHTVLLQGTFKRTGADLTSSGGNITNTNMGYVTSGKPYPSMGAGITFISGDTLFGGIVGSDRVITVSCISRGSTITTGSSLGFSATYTSNTI